MDTRLKLLHVSILIFCLLPSCTLTANESIIDCNGPDWKHGSLGGLETLELKEEISFEGMLKELLKAASTELDLLANLETNPSSIDTEYVVGVIELLEAERSKSLSCLWGNYRHGDVLRKFVKHEAQKRRWGYVISRKGSLVAYIYSRVAIV